jgi:hypothetical protein
MRFSAVVLVLVLLPSFGISATIYVPDNYSTIQGAIDASSNGDTIIVRAGTYFERLVDFKGRAIHLKSEQGPAFTMIDALGAGSVVAFTSGEFRTSILEGFTITNGNNSGVYIDESHPTIRNNVITGNQGQWNGGGIYASGVSSLVEPLIENNHIFGNSATRGGGIALEYTSSRTGVFGNNIQGNSASREGGGIYGFGVKGRVDSNIIRNNNAVNNQGIGGGLYFGYSGVEIVNNFIEGNSATYGGGIAGGEGGHKVLNNTIYGNSAAKEGGGLWGDEFYPCCNNILWANTPDQIKDGVGGSGYGYFCNDIQGGWPGQGNIDKDPRLVDPVRGDFHLSWNSPCLNRGTNKAALSAVDIEGDPRIAFGNVDMGADEFYYHLYSIGDVLPGSPIDIKVVGAPGFSTLLALGTGIQDPPQATPHGDLWLTMPLAKSWQLGAMPNTGILTMPATVPSGWLPGSQYPFQALVGPWGGSTTRLTNLMNLTVE